MVVQPCWYPEVQLSCSAAQVKKKKEKEQDSEVKKEKSVCSGWFFLTDRTLPGLFLRDFCRLSFKPNGSFFFFLF